MIVIIAVTFYTIVLNIFKKYALTFGMSVDRNWKGSFTLKPLSLKSFQTQRTL